MNLQSFAVTQFGTKLGQVKILLRGPLGFTARLHEDAERMHDDLRPVGVGDTAAAAVYSLADNPSVKHLRHAVKNVVRELQAN